MATGKAEYADKIERACFNAAPGAVTSDFKALQYFSCPNQVIADKTSNHNLYFRGNESMSYRPNPWTACCAGQVNRIMPNFAARMWLSDGADGITAALYGPSRVTTQVGKRKQEVTIVEETDYPFSERIDFEIRTSEPVTFALSVRIPGWCRQGQVLINGRRMRAKPKPASFVKIKRKFRHNDRVTLILPMRIKLSRWPAGGVGLERGPLVYALRIEEDWKVGKGNPLSTKAFPSWNLYPASAWNYALALNSRNLRDNVEVVHLPASIDPWSIDSAPSELRVPARRIRNWKIVKKKKIIAELVPGAKTTKLTGDFGFTPTLPSPETIAKRSAKKVETVTLVPYGCTKLRISVFPTCRPP